MPIIFPYFHLICQIRILLNLFVCLPFSSFFHIFLWYFTAYYFDLIKYFCTFSSNSFAKVALSLQIMNPYSISISIHSYSYCFVHFSLNFCANKPIKQPTNFTIPSNQIFHFLSLIAANQTNQSPKIWGKMNDVVFWCFWVWRRLVELGRRLNGVCRDWLAPFWTSPTPTTSAFHAILAFPNGWWFKRCKMWIEVDYIIMKKGD